MTAIAPANARPVVVVDPAGRGVADPSGFLLDGVRVVRARENLQWALPLGQSGVNRYLPNFSPGDVIHFGMDFSFLVPPGVGISTGVLQIFLNTAAKPRADADFTVEPVEVRGRRVYARVGGGIPGTDYQFSWAVTDTYGDIWERSVLLLVAYTS